jgi:DNA-binding response OmpR family regulator
MRKVLFAHPDRKLTEMYLRHLEPHFSVDSAHDGLTAVRRFRRFKPSIIVSEYNLPMLSGLSLLRFARSRSGFNTIPFIFFSDHQDVSQALSFGANDWINISTSQPEHLLERIYHHLKINRYVQIN